jgi:hypothetical protein
LNKEKKLIKEGKFIKWNEINQMEGKPKEKKLIAWKKINHMEEKSKERN